MFGGVSEFDALAFGVPNNESIRYFQNQYNNLINNSANFIGDIGQRFIDTATDLYNRYVSPEAISRIRNIIYHVDNIKVNDYIYPITELSDFQQANLNMQRWIMASPDIRQLYNEQRCDGYSDTYFDFEPGTIGDTQYDYRMVMDGVVRYTYDDQGEINGTVRTDYYLDSELKEGDRYLSLEEKTDILSVWDVLKTYIEEGEQDPTSAIGGYL